MQTQQIVRASAQVIRITSIAPGNIYKRFDPNYEDRTLYGIVRNVHNDGDNTIIEATEYCYRYGSMTAEHKVINGNKEYVIFPATIEELTANFSEVIERKKSEIEKSKQEIKTAEKIIEETQKLISGEMQKDLSTPLYQELSQKAWQEKRERISTFS